MVEVTPEVLASVAGSLISILLFLLPMVSRKFYELADEWKQAINGGTVVLVSVVIMVLGCNSIIVINFECTSAGLIDYVQVVLTAVMANAATFVTFRRLGQRVTTSIYRK